METFDFYFYDSEFMNFSFREYSLEMEDIYQINFTGKKWKNLNKKNKIWLACYIKYLCVEFNWKQLIKIHEIPENDFIKFDCEEIFEEEYEEEIYEEIFEKF